MRRGAPRDRITRDALLTEPDRYSGGAANCPRAGPSFFVSIDAKSGRGPPLGAGPVAPRSAQGRVDPWQFQSKLAGAGRRPSPFRELKLLSAVASGPIW